jgi:PmbA protein
VFEGGVLGNYLCGTYAARKIGRATTANAGGITNFHLAPGRTSPAEIIASVDQGLYLTSISGPGANHMTGDFSQGGQGLWIDKGELSYPVDEFTIASSFPAMLAGVVMVGDDLDWRDAVASPTIKIERMTLSGA